jgi:glycosyltransferase involved in cell wall biosynthesis
VQVHTDFLSPHFGNTIRNKIRKWIALFVLRRSARIRVILERTKDDLRAKGISGPITVLPIYVPIDRFEHLPRLKHPRWKINSLFVGRLENEKRPELALESVAHARKAGHDIGLTVVGSGRMQDVLREKAKQLAITDRVEFLGWQRDIAPYLQRADIFLCPSRFEGYGLAIIEALAAGVPVLATDVGIAREAGAMVVSLPNFKEEFVRWIESGPRTASLAHRPYVSQEEYVLKYCEDIAKAVAH